MNSEALSISPRVLVAPLDWGLGHATRCIPIIYQLLAQNCTVLLAGEGKTETLLRAEFPELQFLHLKGYNINYGKNGWDLIGKLLLQIPKIIETMDEEHEWLKKVIEEHQINAVISDNRFGLFNDSIYSVFVTHQLLVKTSLGQMADELLQKLNYQYVNGFAECWVPDVEGAENLSGDLSHPAIMPQIPVHYLGALSRMSGVKEGEEKHLLIMLSGPEPQRTLFEELLLQQLAGFTDPVVFVRGLPGEKSLPAVAENIQVHNYLGTAKLQQEIENASMVISRCGYSSVMDLLALQKKSILIPTPAQTEQEYLAKHLMAQNRALCIPQSKFKLTNAIELAQSFNYKKAYFTNEALLQNTVQQFVENVVEKVAQQQSV